MWIISEQGFYSAVQHRDDPTLLMIRARSLGDLTELQALDSVVEAVAHAQQSVSSDGVGSDDFTEPRYTPDADYPWRMTMPADVFGAAVAEMVLEIDYDNFKSRVGRVNRERAHTYSSLWSKLHDIEREVSAKVRRARPGRLI